MKKLLSTIAGLSVLAAGVLAVSPAQAQFYTFGENADDDLNDLWLNGGNAIINTEQFNVTNQIATAVGYSGQTAAVQLLQNPEQIDSLYAGDVYDSDTAPSGLGVYSKEGCTVDAGCAIKAIGLVNTLKCAGSVSNITDPQDWANCTKDLDYDAYLAASACTYGSCPGFATLPGQKVVACNNSVNSVLAGNSYLNLPSTLEPQKKELQIGWLSQG
ncbi:MAG: hypothetical protein SXA11_02915 [Cyanobacteriota bacterium]|nr:hypothetical protein [Cyanobacteriota bacterium]